MLQCVTITACTAEVTAASAEGAADRHLVALDALPTAGAVQRGRLKGEPLVPTSFALVLVCLVNGFHVTWWHPCTHGATSVSTAQGCTLTEISCLCNKLVCPTLLVPGRQHAAYSC